MRLLKLLPFTVLIAGAIAPACSSKEGGTTAPALCTPNAFVFCKCKDLRDGSKQCSEDGKSFSECDCGAPPEDTNVPPEDTFTPIEDTTPPPLDMGTSALDKCPGKTVAVDATKEVIIDDDTSTGTDDAKGEGACAVATAKDHVYAVVPTGSGKLTVKITGKGTFDPTLYARELDCATGKQLACGETTGAGGAETFQLSVTTGKTYYIFADGKAGSEGGYTLSLKLTTGAFCGDGNVDNGEGCDDGNKTPGDGCENDCRPTGDGPGSDTCPGLAAHVWPGKTLTFTGSTELASGNYKSDKCVAGGSAQDRVYLVTAHKTGTMNVELDAAYNAIVYAKDGTACTGTTELACANDVGGTGPGVEKISFPVTDGKTYSVFVDGALSYKGTFTLKLSIP